MNNSPNVTSVGAISRVSPSSPSYGQPEPADYGSYHATVVDSIRYVTVGQPEEDAAHEVLQRLRDQGLPIPPRPDDE